MRKMGRLRKVKAMGKEWRRFGRPLWTKKAQVKVSVKSTSEWPDLLGKMENTRSAKEFSELEVLELELFPPLEIRGMTVAVRSQRRPQTRIRVNFKYFQTVSFESDILIVYIYLFHKLNL